MSYCRWSTDDFHCDLYCYESVHDGYMTHVAKYKKIFKSPLPELVPFDKDHIEEWLARHKHVMNMLTEAESASLELPYDGETFHDETLADFLDRLILLRNAGYRFPYTVIEEVQEEISNINTKVMYL